VVSPSSTPAKRPDATSTSAASAGPATIRSITSSALPQGQRISVEFTHEIQFTGDRVAGPARVFFNFHNARVSASVTEAAQALSGQFLKTVRVGHPASGVTRLVLDLAGHPRYSSFTFYDPFRLCIDIVDSQAPTSPVSSLSNSKSTASTSGPSTGARG